MSDTSGVVSGRAVTRCNPNRRLRRCDPCQHRFQSAAAALSHAAIPGKLAYAELTHACAEQSGTGGPGPSVLAVLLALRRRY